MEKVLELNKILDEEIDFCEKFENLLSQKKEILVHSKVDKLKDFDEKIYDAQKRLQELNLSRINISKEFGDGNVNLSDIIKTIDDKKLANELETKRKKIQVFAQKIAIMNKVINSLIEHSLKMIDGSILAIASAIKTSQTKGDYYNKLGVKEEQHLRTLSAIIEDA